MIIAAIPGLPLYGVSPDGSVWSQKKKGPNRLARSDKWRQLKTRVYPRTGYSYVALQCGDREKSYLVHRLVARAFIGPRPPKYQINHKDGNKSNNSSKNLEYITARANLEHAWETGLIVIGKPKLTQEQVDEIRALYRMGERQAAIATKFGVGPSAISDIVNYKTWKAA